MNYAAAPYILTQADADVGEVGNIAVATGLARPSNPSPTPEPAEKTLAAKAALALNTIAALNDSNDDGEVNPDQTITP